MGILSVIVMNILAFIVDDPNPSVILQFLNGFIVQLGCEFSGLNQYYVDYYKWLIRV